MKKSNLNNGFSLVENLVAMSIFLIGILSVSFITIFQNKMLTATTSDLQVVTIADQVIQEVLSRPQEFPTIKFSNTTSSGATNYYVYTSCYNNTGIPTPDSNNISGFLYQSATQCGTTQALRCDAPNYEVQIVPRGAMVYEVYVLNLEQDSSSTRTIKSMYARQIILDSQFSNNVAIQPDGFAPCASTQIVLRTDSGIQNTFSTNTNMNRGGD